MSVVFEQSVEQSVRAVRWAPGALVTASYQHHTNRVEVWGVEREESGALAALHSIAAATSTADFTDIIVFGQGSVLVSDSLGLLSLLHTESSSLRRIDPSHDGVCNGVCASGDGQLLASVGDDATVNIIDANSLRLIATSATNARDHLGFNDAKFCYDNLLATVNDAAQLQLWDTRAKLKAACRCDTEFVLISSLSVSSPSALCLDCSTTCYCFRV
eukprot:m.345893 g.345893  ORF g.345893 m.345893 type:complete len:216 (+) comp55821_c0_seq7:2-649(+)